LNTDYIDLLQIHWPDRYVPIFGSPRYDATKVRVGEVTFEEQVAAMGLLLKSGKIRAWGVSNETPFGLCEFARVCDAVGVQRPVSVQNSYSLLGRSDEIGMVEAMVRLGVTYLPYSPLSAGVLSGKYAGLKVAPKGSRLSLFGGGSYFDRYEASQAPSAVAEYTAIAAKHGLTPSAFAIAFCDARPFPISTIIGATSLAQLDDNLAGFAVKWTAEMEADCERVYAQYPDPWRMLVRDGG